MSVNDSTAFRAKHMTQGSNVYEYKICEHGVVFPPTEAAQHAGTDCGSILVRTTIPPASCVPGKVFKDHKAIWRWAKSVANATTFKPYTRKESRTYFNS